MNFLIRCAPPAALKLFGLAAAITLLSAFREIDEEAESLRARMRILENSHYARTGELGERLYAMERHLGLVDDGQEDAPDPVDAELAELVEGKAQ